jgi:hypothetical protein
MFTFPRTNSVPPVRCDAAANSLAEISSELGQMVEKFRQDLQAVGAA